MTDTRSIEEHVARIAARSEELERRWDAQRSRVRRAAGPSLAAAMLGGPREVLVAEGDSWFDYPGADVLDALEGIFDYEVVSVAHHGDTLESMAYGESQLDGLYRELGKLARRNLTPKAILLSGGGNDIAGAEFPILLNHRLSGLDTVNEDIVTGLVDVRLRSAYVALILKLMGMCRRHFQRTDIPVVLHGYAHPVPDGRGFLGGWAFLPGPWLRPGFLQKGHGDLALNTDAVSRLIDRFNAMLLTIPAEPGLGHVRVVDVRHTLSNELLGDGYRQDWANELHPKPTGFEAVATALAGVLGQL